MTNETRAAELHKLLDFFERLASRGSRRANVNQTGTTRPTTPTLSHSSPLLSDHSVSNITPLVANIVNTRKGTFLEKPGGHAKRPRRTGHSGDTTPTSSHTSDNEDAASILSAAKFPLAKQYQFTFRHMLHKLYGRDDWLKKVQEALEKSQLEYKPLAEKRVEEGPKENLGSPKPKIAKHEENLTESRTVRKEQPGTPKATRPRFLSASNAGNVPVSGRLAGNADKDRIQDEIRVLKRRCVGRRKSMSGVKDTEGGQAGGGWVYDGRGSRFEDRSADDMGSRRRVRCLTLAGITTAPATDVDTLKSQAARETVTEKRAATGKPTARKRALTTAGLNVADCERARGISLKRQLAA
ncbi:hypothetical protein CC1G_12221 [Coprinopsis cinerea okayama7|uniref:Uncharacterized protein n=1 Tax=Coprinopsis cinerea (strain Okayama-7 / 130 / ATCC MYA-4618 / FGSC 9003) TaxID=240176 RepID=A8NA45_COPC7|nr:hypothetical protein CC1G_12221 [Coprinopsis cinerea okayama7\|eukprot:XP_001831701.2 hypothetical protein CC1G_12221 [Coprinopsis cinerea okayama7\